MYLFNTNREARELEGYNITRNMPDMRLPAIADRAVWEKPTN